MKNGEHLMWILLGLLCFGCANHPLLAGTKVTAHTETWGKTLSVKEEDVENVEKYRLRTVETVQICLHKVVPSAKNSQTGCDERVTLNSSFDERLLLSAKQICEKIPQGDYYITPELSQTVMDYVLKCETPSIAPSSLISLKKLCSSPDLKLKSAQEKFCPISSGNCAELQATVTQLKQELTQTKEQLKKANAQLKQAKAKAQELTQTLETSKKCEIRTLNKNRITVVIKDYPLRFVKVKSTYRNNMKKGIRIALTDQQASSFHQQSMAFLPPNYRPIYPNILKAVSEDETPKYVGKFWIQERTIEPKLYEEIIRGASADSVSYEEAMTVIETLNGWCQGKAQFKLPEEKQFVYLARNAYNPIKEGLQSCGVVKERVALDRVKKLLGHQWQLTSSYCSSFYNRRCNVEQSRIKKGGSIESKYAAECMPEYRAESMSDIREPNTTFRLVLKVIK